MCASGRPSQHRPGPPGRGTSAPAHGAPELPGAGCGLRVHRRCPGPRPAGPWAGGQSSVEVKLPAPLAHLAHLAQRPHGRYRLSCPVEFTYRGDEVAAQAASGAIRYDISHDPVRGRWYIDASWKAAPAPAPSLGELREAPVLAVDLNHGHLAAWAVTPDGNPARQHPLECAGTASPRRLPAPASR